MKIKKLKEKVLVTTGLVLVNCSYAFGADLTGAINQATTDAQATLNPVTGSIKPLIYLIIAILVFIRLAFLTKEWFQVKNDERESKEVTSKMLGTLGLAIGVSIGLPVLIKIINALFGTSFTF